MSTTAPYDPELPFLVDLEQSVREYAVRAQTAGAQPERAAHPPAQRRRRAGRPVPGRAIRRTAILAALLCLLGATAYGTRVALFTKAPSPSTPSQTRQLTVADGQAGGDRWTLRVYARGGQLCGELDVLAQQVSSRCAPPPAASALELGTVVSATHVYVFGIAGAGVDAIAVRVGATTDEVPTRTLGGRGAQIGATPSTRYFAAVMRRGPGRLQQTATATALDVRRDALGAPQTACLGHTGALGCAE